MSYWSPYKPTDAAPWNIERVVHLHRRAAFAATWGEIERDLRDEPEAAVTRLIDGQARLEGVPEGFESLAAIIGQAAVDSGSAERLKAWWLYRCLFSPHPLQERLTLMWHNHFATSNLKVDDLRLMKRQNELLRQRALSPFGELLAAMIRDPALLKWLDAPANRKEHPNENLARELMELFTLGIGHYAEADVQQAARALSGWTVRQGEFFEQPAAHDDSEKSILGRTGNWNGSELVQILLAQPATSQRLAWRLCAEFCGERVADKPALDELADGLRRHELDMRWGVETILRSELFFSRPNLASRVCDPVSFVVGPLRALECWRDPPSTIVLAEWLRRMEQDLFYPPNVGGWPGGRAWLSTRAILARSNCMAALVAGELNSPARPPDLDQLAARHVGAKSVVDTVNFLSRLLYGRVLDNVPPTERPAQEDQSPLSRSLLALLTCPQAHLH
jgi:uncharacterized protein (DUF1800 family)